MIRSKDGRPLNGNLLYIIRPIQMAVESFYPPDWVPDHGFQPLWLAPSYIA